MTHSPTRDSSEVGDGSITVPKGVSQERYINRYLEHIIDDVCIYSERVKNLETEYEAKEENEKGNLEAEIGEIPLRAVPDTQNGDSPKHKVLKAVQLQNEVGEPAGLLGWCFVCRGPADLFCKDTRVPLCSVDCKMVHLEELGYVESLDNELRSNQKNEYLEDAKQIFIYLCKTSGKDPVSDMNITSLKSKTLSLELLVSIMERSGPTFSSKKEFKEIVREHLCDSILKNSVSTDKAVFSYSLGIFTFLVVYLSFRNVNHFRDVLRAEIAVFIEDIFLRMLDSGNSSFTHRSLALQVFYKICLKAKPMLEFYVNYDCNIHSTNMVEKVVEMLCRIAQGKYTRAEYMSMINPVQEQQLKTLALETLAKLVKSLLQFSQEHQIKVEDTLRVKKTLSDEEKEKEKVENDKDAEDKDNPAETVNTEAFDKMDEIEKQRTMKNEIQKGIQKFNFKIKNGMKHFIQLGVINPEDAKSVGAFFKNTPNLSKEKLGEYFGEPDAFNIKVMTEFTELVNLQNLTLDDGLRVYLNLFDLPGEGQKIDRVMQTFASKYFQDNPTSFKSGSAAYTLSFLLIMLQTDAHNTTIKEKDKMKLTDFVKLARGINDGDNLPSEELVGFYNRILENPLALHAAAKAKKTQQDARVQSLRKKEEQFKIESEAMIEKSQKMMKMRQDSQYYRVKNSDQIRPLFTEVIWSPVLAVFSMLFEQSDDQRIVRLCLDGIMDSILLCSIHNMSTERNAFVSTLAKFSNLTALREMKDKNIECIQLMLQLAINNGGLLRMSWKYVLECISKINYYCNDYASTNEREAVERNVSDALRASMDLNTVNYVYSRSSTFNLEEIIDFITCLCQISEDELKNPSGPSTFSLQKIVEVAHFNVDRVMFIWTQIWRIMKEHISNVAIHSTPEISFFAVDSLKQLSIKFLLKDEMASLEFQKEFLHPFEKIYQQINNDDLKELIINCCSYIISHVMKNIKSGWKVIIDILMMSAESKKESIVRLSFSTVEKIIKADLDSLRDVFTDLTVLLIKFAQGSFEEIGIMALKDLSSLLEKKASTPAKPLEQANQSHSHVPSVVDSKIVGDLNENSWTVILKALSKLCLQRRKRIFYQATVILFDILKVHGEQFPREFWKRILHEIMRPLLESTDELTLIRKTSISGGRDETIQDNEPLREIFSRIVDLHSFFRPVLPFFTKDILEFLVDCSKSSNEILAKISINTLRFIINSFHAEFIASEWQTLLLAFNEIFDKTLPRQLMTYKGNFSDPKQSPKFKEEYNFNSQECLTHCIIQLQMIALVKDVVDERESYLSDQQLETILEVLEKSYQFAKDFNEQKYLRFCLWRDDSMKDMDQLPGLIKQEKEALSAYFFIQHKLYNRKLQLNGKGRSDRNSHLQDFVNLGITLMKSFYQKNEEYLAIIGHETGKNRENEVNSLNEDVEKLSLEEAFKKQCSKLARQELEREIINLRSVFSEAYLPKLLNIETSELEFKEKDLVKNLLNLSFYYVPKELVFGEHFDLSSKIYVAQDEGSQMIRSILNKFFDR